MDNIKQILDFSLRNLRYAGEGDQSSFTATLAVGRQVVAEISCAHSCDDSEDPVFEAVLDASVLNSHYWSQFERFASGWVGDQDAETETETETEPASAWLIEMANQAYHARRLQVMSLRHTAYRLHGDKPGVFRYLHNQPYSLAIEGKLRLTFGRQLETVYRRGDGAKGVDDAEAQPKSLRKLLN